MSKLLNRFAIAVSACTLFLIFVGGLVKSTDSGLAVPDWPLSYGQWMPPMIGGIFFEHGHRMVAAAVGFLTVVLGCLSLWKENRGWVKKAAWAAVGLVILQGVFGGITVLLRLPKVVSITHACLAQTFFCLVTAIAVWTSNYWIQGPSPRAELTGRIPLHRMSLALFGLTYIQLVLGAILRHSGHALPFHISGAALVFGFFFWIYRRIWAEHADITILKKLSLIMLSVLLVQIALGIVSFFLLIHRFNTIPPPFAVPLTISFHVAVGALFLGLSTVLALIAHKTKPVNSPPLKTSLTDYFNLTKPGISLTAAITALAGFILGSKGSISALPLVHTCIGTLLSAAGAGCLNMLIEKDSDGLMQRTKLRPLPSGRLQPGEVLFLGTFCSVAGVLYLSWAVNFLTAFLAGLTVSIYLYLYTPLKKISSLCIAVGAVAGALPPVMGWTAATGSITMEPVALFGILFFWQFPHFLSLAWLYKDDYKSAGLHMLPNIDGGDASTTARSLVFNSVALLVVSVTPFFLGLTGPAYLGTAIATGLAMIYLSLKFYFRQARQEAKLIFFFSLLYIPLLVLFMVLSRSSNLLVS